MDHNLNSIPKKNIYIFIIITTGIILRLYDYNNEDLWFDELLSFWVSDPNISFLETFNRNSDVNAGGIVFAYFLKLFFSIFGYNSDIARISTILFGVISLLCLVILINKLKVKNILIPLVFLFGFNSYLISYDHELRLYSSVVLISILNFIFFYNLIKKKRNLDFFLVSTTNLLGVLNHSFFLLILLSQFIFIFLNNKINITTVKYVISQFIVILIFAVISKDVILMSINTNEFWIKDIEFKFFLDFFFSRFFSSKILGSIYLIIFISVLFHQRKVFFKFDSFYFYLITIIFISYFIPLIYAEVKVPILTDRYIIFIVVPILLLISYGIMNITNQKFRYSILILIILSTFTDTLLRVKKNEITKPEFKKAINYIAKSTSKNILIDGSLNHEIDYNVIKNYLISLNKSLIIKDKIDYLDEKIWKLCYLPITDFNCDISNNKKNIREIDDKDYNLIKIKLLNVE